MAAFGIKDVYSIMNVLARQATGQADISVVDHTGFIDAGTKTLATGTDNVLNSIYRTIAILRFQSRTYTGKFGLIAADSNAFNSRTAKISYYSSDNTASGAFNTDLQTGIANGFDNGTNDGASVGNMWEQNLPKVVERFFLKEAAYDKGYTTPLVQLHNAFNTEADFVRFWNGVMVEIENDVQSTTEARNRSVIADRIAGTYALVKGKELGSECVVDLIAEFNTAYGTNYSKAYILANKKEALLKLFIARFGIISDRLEERSVFYHDPMTIAATETTPAYNVLRFTPKANQKFMYASEFFKDLRINVLPNIFNPEMLPAANGEGVTYWQSNKAGDRLKIKCKPALPAESKVDVSAGVELDDVIGILFDDEAIKSTMQFQGVYTTPVEARKLYTNTWMHWKFGAISDYTENVVIFILGAGGNEDPK